MRDPGRVTAAALALLPGALVVVLSFNAGGFFVTAPALAAVALAVILALRTTLAERPFAGIGAAAGVAAGALGVFAIWTLASAWWSDAPARALIEFDRALLYLLAVVTMASLPRSPARLRLVLGGVALGIVGVCVVAFVTRVAPDVWPIAPNVEADRLSYPLTYWNALGLLTSIGIVLCLFGTTSEREPGAVRVAAAAALPALAATLLLTFSRGAIAACALGVVAYLVLARPRGLPGTLIAAGPTVVIAAVKAYDADLLATARYTGQAGIEQGHDVAVVVALCCAAAAALRGLALPLDGRLARIELGPRMRRLAAGGALLAVIGSIGAAAALGAPGYVSRQYDRFVEGAELAADSGDVRGRLSDPGNNGRLEHWRAALVPFHEAPLIGRGAGTFQLTWARERPIAFEVNDGHSLYLEVLGELGLVGLALVVVALVALLAGAAARMREKDRHVQAAVTAVLLAWALRTGIDWDWEMPAVTLPVLSMAAAAAAVPESGGRLGGRLGRLPRVAAGLALLVLAVTPALAAVSQRHLDRAIEAFKDGDCETAIDAALDASSALDPRPEPWEIVGYCDVKLGKTRLAVRALENAVERDPDSWDAHYGLALVQAAAGRDPRLEARIALRLNPRDRLTRGAVEGFRTGGRRAWRKRALALPLRLPR